MSDTAITPEIMPSPESTTARQIKDAFQTEELKAAAERALDELSERWKEVSSNTTDYVKQNPGRSVLIGLGVGFAIGMLFRRD